MGVYEKKCPICGGNVIFDEQSIFGTCDSCEKTVYLSELNRQSYSYYYDTSKEYSEKVGENGEYKSAFDMSESTELSENEVYEKIDLALETDKWTIARAFCDELLRRNPKNSYAYLYKLMAELKVCKKESLYRCEKSFEENVNYIMLIRFGDFYLKTEIEGYLNQIKQRISEENVENMYQTARQIILGARSEKDYMNAALYFSKLGGYKDSKALYEQCLKGAEKAKMAQAQINRKKEKNKTIILIIIAVAILLFMLSIIIPSIMVYSSYNVENTDDYEINTEFNGIRCFEYKNNLQGEKRNDDNRQLIENCQGTQCTGFYA